VQKVETELTAKFNFLNSLLAVHGRYAMQQNKAADTATDEIMEVLIRYMPEQVKDATKIATEVATRMNKTAGYWTVDYRRNDACSVPVLINRALSLTEDIYVSLFEFIRDDAPEYEKGFRHITDQLHRFCMLLFAQAVANEKSVSRR
jgi:hypothetical protein